MDSSSLIGRLKAGAEMIHRLVDSLTADHACWKPAPGKWSIVEVAAHLLDEEREDFRVRLDLLLHEPGKTWPGIDPKAWVKERGYAERDLQETLGLFMEERKKSIEWLENLESPKWENVYEHPLLGAIRAGDILAAWTGHDLLHVRQIAGIHWEYVKHLAEPHVLDYAGEW